MPVIRFRVSKIVSLAWTALFLFSSAAFASPANAKQITLKNLYFSMTYPSPVKLPKNGCASLKITYKSGIKLQRPGSFGFVTVVLVADDELAGFNIWTLNQGGDSDRLLTSGSGTLRFCRDDWLNSDGDGFVGISPGTHKIGIVTNFGTVGEKNLEELEKTSLIKFVS